MTFFKNLFGSLTLYSSTQYPDLFLQRREGLNRVWNHEYRAFNGPRIRFDLAEIEKTT